jgi:hypothetical protein
VSHSASLTKHFSSNPSARGVFVVMFVTNLELPAYNPFSMRS